MSQSAQAPLPALPLEEIYKRAAKLEESLRDLQYGQSAQSAVSGSLEAKHLGWDQEVVQEKCKMLIALMKHDVKKRGAEWYDLGTNDPPRKSSIDNCLLNKAQNVGATLQRKHDCVSGIHATKTSQHHLIISVKAPKSVEDASLGWRVNIFFDDDVLYEGLNMMDPFTCSEEMEFQWYLEEYPITSPYTLDRAKAAKATLENYIISLRRQLHLDEVFRLIQEVSRKENQRLLISIIESQEAIHPASGTIHRLHWECLESPGVWPGSDLAVEIRRSIGFSDIPAHREFDGLIRNRFPRYNILLVIARDTSSQSTTREIEPFRTLRTLLNLRDRLEQAKAPMGMQVTVLRPGTFSELKLRLQQSTERHGPGYFGAVHFDMHGSVSGEEAYLHFCKRDAPWKLAKVKASSVAKLLKDHHVDFAFLNSCETAKASRENAANLAQTFMSGGIPFTLAMSFEVLGDTATEFANTFYECLLWRGRESLQAVADARCQLRVNDTRYARFQREISLADWIVPVVYSYGSHIAIAPSHERERLENQAIAHDGHTQMKHLDNLLLGRDLDTLRLEHALIANPFLGLVGKAGVGKTALVKQLMKIWGPTEFVRHILYLPFSMFHSHTLDEWMRHILSSSLKRSCCAHRHSESGGLSSVPDEESQGLEDRVLALIKRHSVVIIFDELVDAFAMLGYVGLRQGMSRNDQSRFTRFFEKLSVINRASMGSQLRSYSLLIGHGFGGWWDLNFASIPHISFFKLEGLELEHALQLCATVLSVSSDILVQRRVIDSLEQCCLLLDRLPEAILIVISQLQSQGIAPEQFFSKLLSHSAAIDFQPGDTNFRRSSMLQDLIWSSMPDNPTSTPQLVQMNACLGLFWSKGPILYDFCKKLGFSKTNNWELEYWRVPIAIDRDRGFFEIDATGRLVWLHPLASIHWHHLLVEHLNEATFPPQSLLQSALTEHLDKYTDAKNISDLSLRASRREARSEFFNALSLFELALQPNPTVDVLNSTFEVLSDYLKYCLLFLSAAEFSTIAEYGKKYAVLPITSLGGPRPELDELHHKLFILLKLDELYRDHYSSRMSPDGDLSSIAISTFQAYEKANGAIRDPKIKLLKATAMNAMSLDTEDQELAKALTEARSVLEAEIYDPNHPDNQRYLAENNYKLHEELSNLMPAVGLPQGGGLQPMIPCQDPRKVHEYKVGRPLMTKIATILREKGMYGPGRTDFEALPSDLLQEVDDYVTFMRAESQVDNDASANGHVQGLLINTLMKFKDPANRLKDVEEAENNRDWSNAAGNLVMLAERSQYYGEFDAAMAYQNRVMELCKEHPDEISAKFVAKAQRYYEELRRFIESMRLQEMASVALSQGQFQMFALYSRDLHLRTLNGGGGSYPIQKEHFKLMDLFARLLEAIAEDGGLSNMPAEDIDDINDLSRDAAPFRESLDSTTRINKGKQPEPSRRPNESTTADMMESVDLAEYSRGLRRAFQAMKLHLQGGSSRQAAALVIYDEMIPYTTTRPHLHSLLSGLQFCRAKLVS